MAVNGISAEHQAYLAAGGYGFIIGDGALDYGLEQVGEVYYSLNLPRYHASISPDYQLIINPAYNRDRRGPVHVVALRLHVEFEAADVVHKQLFASWWHEARLSKLAQATPVLVTASLKDRTYAKV